MTDIEERQELEDKIKDCNRELFYIPKDKSASEQKSRADYLLRCELLRLHRGKYDQEDYE